jgi:hypothetical protein
MFLQELECLKALDVSIIAKFWPRIYIQWLMQMERTFTTKNIVKMTSKLLTKHKTKFTMRKKGVLQLALQLNF